MTTTYGEVGISYGAVTFSYDGTELSLGPYSPVIFGLARNFPIPLAATDTLAARRTASGPAAAYTVTGGLTSYTATGVIED